MPGPTIPARAVRWPAACVTRRAFAATSSAWPTDALDAGLYLRESCDSGHLLLIAPVGAYNTTQSMQFIEYRPAVVLIHGNREVSLIRAAEDLELVCAAERLPAHLARAEAESAARVLPLRMAGG
jgi:hypothetical protein